MTIKIAEYIFEGPFKSATDLKDQSGVYVILCKNAKYKVIDVGESKSIKTRVENHDREDCWKKHCPNPEFAAHYIAGENSRKKIEKEIRQKYNPPCGDR